MCSLHKKIFEKPIFFVVLTIDFSIGLVYNLVKRLGSTPNGKTKEKRFYKMSATVLVLWVIGTFTACMAVCGIISIGEVLINRMRGGWYK